MVRPVPALALDFLRRVEGCRLDAYADPAGVWTAGYGHTGPDVVQGHQYSQGQAESWLGKDAEVAAARLRDRVKAEVLEALSDHQYAALISFVFNLGAAPGWTIWRVLNAGDLDQIPVQLLRFDKVRQPDGSLRTLAGLAHRRTAEIALWRTADVAVAAAIAGPTSAPGVSSGETRRSDTPPAPMPEVAGQANSVRVSLATAVAAAPVAILHLQGGAQAVSNALSPYADKSEVIQRTVGGLACLCAALAVLAVGLQWLHHRRLRGA